jgi:1,6-anhydro-N-acetylmuramate kinase
LRSGERADGWMDRAHPGKQYDRDGAWAASGKSTSMLLARMMAHPFFSLVPPKSCGREQFNLSWVMAQLSPGIPPENVQATLAELTAQSVADALSAAGCRPDELAVCGGGAFNSHLMRRLSAATGVTASDTSRWGIAAGRRRSHGFCVARPQHAVGAHRQCAGGHGSSRRPGTRRDLASLVTLRITPRTTIRSRR